MDGAVDVDVDVDVDEDEDVDVDVDGLFAQNHQRNGGS